MEQHYTPQILNFFLNLMKTKEVFENTSTRVHQEAFPKHKAEDRLSIYRLYSVEQILYKTSTFPDRNDSKAFKNTYMNNAYDDVDDYKDKYISPNLTEFEKRRIT